MKIPLLLLGTMLFGFATASVVPPGHDPALLVNKDENTIEKSFHLDDRHRPDEYYPKQQQPEIDEEFNFVAQRQTQQRELQSTTENVTIWSQFKESIGLVVVGFLLICLMPCLIWKNEGRHVNVLEKIDYCKNEAVLVNCTEPNDENIGSLVHFTGPVQVGDTTLDLPKFLHLSTPLYKAFLIKRTCYIYQKFEVQTSAHNNVGGSQTRTFEVQQDWTFMGPQRPQLQHNSGETNSRGIWDSIIVAAGGSPNQPSEENPMEEMAAKMGIMVNPNKAPHALVVSPQAHVGAFNVSSEVVLENLQEFTSEGGLIPVPAAYLPDSVEGCPGLMKGSDNVLRTFPEGQQPQNGDCKIVYEYVIDDFDCSFIVKQTKLSSSDVETGGAPEEEAAKDVTNFGMEKSHAMGKCKNEIGDIWMVRKGTHNLEDMVEMAQTDEKNTMKIMRILCWIGLFAGWCMIFAPLITVLSVLPILAALGNFAVALCGLIVSLTCCCTIMTLAYFRYRPIITSGLLAISLGIWGIIIWRGNVAADGLTESPTAAPGAFGG